MHADDGASGEPASYRDLVKILAGARRSVVTRRPEQLQVLTRAAATEGDIVTVVVGDSGLCMPLGPFAVAFPEVRALIPSADGVVPDDLADVAWRAITQAIDASADRGRFKIGIADAHLLDKYSLQLAAFLIERGPIRAFTIVLCSDYNYRDIRWLDFLARARTAGCTMIAMENCEI